MRDTPLKSYCHPQILLGARIPGYTTICTSGVGGRMTAICAGILAVPLYNKFRHESNARQTNKIQMLSVNAVGVDMERDCFSLDNSFFCCGIWRPVPPRSAVTYSQESVAMCFYSAYKFAG